MSTEGHLAIAGAGLLAGALGVWLSARRNGGKGPALLYFGGFMTFGVGGIDAMDSAHLSQHARSLWITGTFGLAAALFALRARQVPGAAGVRTTATLIVSLCLVLFLLELVFRFDPFATLFDF